MEHKIALWIAKRFNQSCERTELEQIKMVYGLEIVLDNVLKLLAILVISLVLGIFKEAMFVLVGFGVLRLKAGGFHFDKNIFCWLVSILITIGGGILASTHILTKEIVMVLFILSGILVAMYAPSETTTFSADRKQKQELKIQSFLMVALYSGLTYIFWDNWVGSTLVIGVVCQTISILPIVNKKYKADRNEK